MMFSYYYLKDKRDIVSFGSLIYLPEIIRYDGEILSHQITDTISQA